MSRESKEIGNLRKQMAIMVLPFVSKSWIMEQIGLSESEIELVTTLGDPLKRKAFIRRVTNPSAIISGRDEEILKDIYDG